MSKKEKKTGDLVRMLGERKQTVDRRLTVPEIDENRDQIMSLLDEKERKIDLASQASKALKAEIAEIDAKISECRRVDRGKVRRADMTVQDWLTRGNEVVRIVKETGEYVGDPRTATAEELQESFLDAKGNIPEGDPQPAGEDPDPPEGDADFEDFDAPGNP